MEKSPINLFNLTKIAIKIILSFLSCIYSFNTLAQSNCPIGYYLRKVKCNGSITEKCVPIDYTCKLCWTADYPWCNGKPNGGSSHYNSYEEAIADVQRRQRESQEIWKEPCHFFDFSKAKIYLDQSDFCGTLNTGCTLCNDLRSKVKPFLDRYRAEIRSYRNMINNKPNMPGATSREYTKLIEQAEQKVKQLETELTSLNDKNYDTVNSLFGELEKDKEELKNTFNSISSGQAIQPSSSTESNSACVLYWTDWVQCLTSPKGSVSYRVQFSKKFCGCGWQFVQLKHTFPYKVRIEVELDGWDCDGKYLKSKFSSAELQANEISGDNGNWHTFGKIKGVLSVTVKGNDGTGNREISVGPNGAQELINGKSVAEIEREKRQAEIQKNVAKTEQEGKEINKIIEGNSSQVSQAYIKSMTEINNQAARSGLNVDNSALRAQAEQLAQINRQHQAFSQAIDSIGNAVINAYAVAAAAAAAETSRKREISLENDRLTEKAFEQLRQQYRDSMFYGKEINAQRYAEYFIKIYLSYYHQEHSSVNGISTYLKSENNYKYYKIIDPMKCFMWFNVKYLDEAHFTVPIYLEKYMLPASCFVPIQNVFTNEYERKNIYQNALFNLRKENRKLTFHDRNDYYYLKPSYNKNLRNNYDEDKAMTDLSAAICADSITNASDVFDYNLSLMWHNYLKSKNMKSFNDVLDILLAQLKYLKKSDLIFEVYQRESEQCLEKKEKINKYFENIRLHDFAGSKYIDDYHRINLYYYYNALYITMKMFPEKEQDILKLLKSHPSQLLFYFSHVGSYYNENEVTRDLLQEVWNEYYGPSKKEYQFMSENANDRKLYAEQLDNLIQFLHTQMN